MAADILAFSETRLRPWESDHDYHLGGFNIHRNYSDNSDTCDRESRPPHGMAVYTKCSSVFVEGNAHGVKIMFGVKDNIQICFIYSPPAMAMISSLKNVFYTLKRKNDFLKPAIIMGDFNIDLQKSQVLSDFLKQKYSLYQMISSYTTDYWSTIDHIYTNIDEAKLFSCGVLESYFSDHKPIYIALDPLKFFD